MCRGSICAVTARAGVAGVGVSLGPALTATSACGELVLIAYLTYCLCLACAADMLRVAVFLVISVLGMRVQEACVPAGGTGERSSAALCVCLCWRVRGCADRRPLFRVGASRVAFRELALLQCYSLGQQPAAGCSRRIDVRTSCVGAVPSAGASVDALHSPQLLSSSWHVQQSS